MSKTKEPKEPKEPKGVCNSEGLKGSEIIVLLVVIFVLGVLVFVVGSRLS